ncbi:MULTISPECIES: flagellar hook-basal body protein [Xanthomonas]|uniref:flagellar hook-basal body protein n=1 Tax=Xanthomonas TaxID=338 RepID=UPI00225E1ED0|nr:MULTISPECIES: flagellar hook basal-body protein [Xanthomonas]MCW0436693.1 hypothetical protein [Xanthomonas sacchari]MDY4297347.1 flagellar hook basal-body protein [Xanthomonas sp. LF02-5]MDY4359141.1 flagellar hook basal-body protein [Xanthomonas sp. LF04-12]
MSDAINAISRSLNADVEGLNAISRNVANINTPGYQSVRGVPDFATVSGVRGALQLSDGPLKETQRGLDLALRGNGFFVVQDGEQRVLTRSGSFVRSADGMLVTRDGMPVLTDSGPLTLPQGDIRVERDGAVWSGDQSLGRLLLVDVADAGRLVPAAGGYRYDGALQDWNGSVEQGAVEQSNVDAAEQTLQLIELTRHAESVQRVISLYDKVLDVGINRVGDN